MTLALACLAEITDPPGKGLKLDVMFNPASVKVTYPNKVQSEEAGGGSKSNTKQSPQPSTAKLDTELVFDTTDDFINAQDASKSIKAGSDVRDATSLISLMTVNPKTVKVLAPKLVEFRWGRFAYYGSKQPMMTKVSSHIYVVVRCFVVNQQNVQLISKILINLTISNRINLIVLNLLQQISPPHSLHQQIKRIH